MVCVKQKEKCLYTRVLGNLIALQIILRNEIQGSNSVFKVTSTLNKVWLIFVLKGIPTEKNSISKTSVACSNTYFFHYIMNPGILGTQTYSKSMAYSEPWNIQKTDGIYTPLKHIVLPFGNSVRL